MLFRSQASAGTIATGDTVHGIVSSEGKISLKASPDGLSLTKDASNIMGAVLIPLDAATTSVGLSFKLSSTSPDRYLVVGDNVFQKVYHRANDSSKTEADGALDVINSSFTGSYDNTYFTGSFLRLSSASDVDGNSGESKIGSITLIENRIATGEVGPVITEVQANVQVNDSENLLGTENKITLKNKADEIDTHDITVGGAYTLKANAEYDILVNNSDIKATVGDATTVKTGTADITVEVNVASSVVNPTVKIVDKDGLLGDGVLTLTSGEEVHTLTNDGTVKLNIGNAYKLACTSSAIVATISGSALLTASAELETIQVDIKAADTSKHSYDVWDFGAEQLENTDTITYHNKLTVDIINSWYPGVTPGTAEKTTIPGDCIAYDEDENPEFVFNAGGKTNNRLRTIEEKLTRYDNKSLKNKDSGVIYKGYIYSNSGSTDAVNVQLAVKAGDIVTFVVSSNKNESDITWRSPSGAEEVKKFPGDGSVAQEMTFYAAEDGLYTLYSDTEKLVVARILRERPTEVTEIGRASCRERV